MSLMKRSMPREVDLWRNGFPFMSGLERIQREVNRAFDEFFHDDMIVDGLQSNRSRLPAVDIEETKDAYVLKAEMPGMKKEDIKISLDNNLLTIKGENKSENERKAENYHRIERFSGAFERSFSLPGGISPDAIEAVYSDGVLSITLPRKEEAREKFTEVKVK